MADQHLLVVDWDYFFENPMDGGEYKDRNNVLLYDWQKAEATIYIDMLWDTRAASFLQMGEELPRAKGYEGFWDRFNIAPDTGLWVADSNRHAGVMHPDTGIPFYDSVWLYDAHHDCGYKHDSLEDFIESPTYSCEDWMLIHACNGSDLHVRYPEWKVYAFTGEGKPTVEPDRQFDDGSTPPVTFTDVFVCRSGAWVPSWCDDQFREFVNAYPYDQNDYPTDDPTPMLMREFDRAKVDEIVKASEMLRNASQ